MKLSALVLYFAATAVASTAISDKPGYHSINFNVYRGNHHSDVVKRDTSPVHHQTVKRNGSVEVSIQNRQTFYVATAKVGSKEDENMVVLDMLTADSWFISADVRCQYNGSNSTDSTLCTSNGSFDAESSETLHWNSSAPQFEAYFDSSSYWATGFWATDTVTIGDIPVPGLSFGVVNKTSLVNGVLGIGAALNEITTDYHPPYHYDNLPLRLKALGIVHSTAYSMYLANSEEPTGTILIGAIDHAKYSGGLAILSTDSSIGRSSLLLPEVTMLSVYIDRGSELVFASSKAIHAVFDSSSSITYFPFQLLDGFTEAINASYSTGVHAYTFDCPSEDLVVTFTFGKQAIAVPLSDMAHKSPTSDRCILDVTLRTRGSSDIAYLGYNFLRNAYIVADLQKTILQLLKPSTQMTSTLKL